MIECDRMAAVLTLTAVHADSYCGAIGSDTQRKCDDAEFSYTSAPVRPCTCGAAWCKAHTWRHAAGGYGGRRLYARMGQ